MKNWKSYLHKSILVTLWLLLAAMPCACRRAHPPATEQEPAAGQDEPSAAKTAATAEDIWAVPRLTPEMIVRARLSDTKRLTNQADIIRGIDFGRAMLEAAKLDARNYKRAIERLVLVLWSLEKENDDAVSTPIYKEAWALFQIAMNLRENLYNLAVYDMERNASLRNYQEALEAAAYIYAIYPEDAPESLHAQQRFQEIQRMMP